MAVFRENRRSEFVRRYDLTPAEVAEIVRINRAILATFDVDYQRRYPDQVLAFLAQVARVPRATLYERFYRVFRAVARALLPRLDRRDR